MNAFHSIVFLDGDEAEEPLRILEEDGVASAALYLSAWDYGGDSEHSPSELPPWGSSDSVSGFLQVPGAGRYILSWNKRLGYIGLVRRTRERKEDVKL